MATVVARHDSRPYVLVEDFDEMLEKVECSLDRLTATTTVKLRFRDEAFVAMARKEWPRYEALTFITHHKTCNDEFKEREAYV